MRFEGGKAGVEDEMRTSSSRRAEPPLAAGNGRHAEPSYSLTVSTAVGVEGRTSAPRRCWESTVLLRLNTVVNTVSQPVKNFYCFFSLSVKGLQQILYDGGQ